MPSFNGVVTTVVVTALSLAHVARADDGCCSHKHQECDVNNSRCNRDAWECEFNCWGGAHKGMLWLPEGEDSVDSSCLKRWTYGCDATEECCPGTVCYDRKCQHPLDICEDSCDTASGICKWEGGDCVPNVPYLSEDVFAEGGSTTTGSPTSSPTSTPTATSTTSPTSTPTSSPSDDGDACPWVTLDWNDVEDPMWHYYGKPEGTTFKGGDYIMDQLWFSHGIKISARTLYDWMNTKDAPYIPVYNRTIGSFVDNKLNLKSNDRFTGGSVRLFDTAKPHGKFDSSDSEYDNPVCSDTNKQDGDPDLGSPNAACPGGGPGEGAGGAPTLSDGSPNPFANCDPVGLICVIQEGDKACPDDEGDGGYITITFREATELQITSFLDIDEGDDTPEVELYFADGSHDTFETESTGDNGLYPLTFDTPKITQVEMADIKYEGSGSLNSLKYRYCPVTPKPKISIKKYAGGPGKCSESDILNGNIEDDTYSTEVDADYTYCYEISYPDDEEGLECLYDVKMTDPAPVGGTGGYIELTRPDEFFCPGDVTYIEGDVSSAPEGGETYYDAYVEGIGKYSGEKVTDTDPARIVVGCSLDYGHTDETICPDEDTVTLLSIKTDDGSIVPASLVDPTSMFYALEHISSDSASPEVSFKVENPFSFAVNMYIQYDIKVAGSTHGAVDPACDQFLGTTSCDANQEAITAGCIVPATGSPFTIVSVYFVSDEAAFGVGSNSAEPYECCELPDEDKSKPIIEYSFKVMCGCPSATSTRRARNLLRSPSSLEF